MRKRTICVLGVWAVGCGALVAGCSGGSSGGGFGPGSGPAPVGSATWDAFYTANPAVQGDAVTVLTAVPSGDLLVGQSSAQVYRVDSNSLAMLEDVFGAGVTSLADLDSSIFAGTGDPLFSPDAQTPGQVLQRANDGTWTVALDYPNSDVVVATIGSHLYAFASPTSAVGSATTSSILVDGRWWEDIADLGSAVITAATAYDSEMWAAGTDGDNALLVKGLFSMGPATVFAPVDLPLSPLPTETAVVTDLLAIDSDLYVAVLCADATNQQIVTRGEVLFTSDGQTFYSVGTFTNDAPRALGWHEDTLYVGTASGELQSYDFGRLAAVEPPVLSNMGVHSIAAVDSNTLLVGVEGNSGAEVLRRTLTTPANPDPVVVVDPQNPGTPPPGTQPPVAQLSYLGSVKAILSAQCSVCHSDPNNAANAGFALSAGMVDDQADYSAVLDRVKVGGGVNGSLLLRKSTDRSPHGGGEALVSGSPQHQTIVEWLSGGAVFQ